MTILIEEFKIENGQIEIVWFYKESHEDSESETDKFPCTEEMIMKVLKDECTESDYNEWCLFYDNGTLLKEFKTMFEHPYVKTLLTNHLNKQ